MMAMTTKSSIKVKPIDPGKKLVFRQNVYWCRFIILINGDFKVAGAFAAPAVKRVYSVIVLMLPLSAEKQLRPANRIGIR